MINFRALQVSGCLRPKEDFHPPVGVLPRYFGGGSWRANLHKEGTKYILSAGGGRKHTGKTKLRIGPFYKEKIFSPLLIRLKTII